MSRRLVAVSAVGVLLLAGCGDSKSGASPRPGGSGTPSSSASGSAGTPSGSAAPGSSATPGGGTSASPGGGTSGSPKASGSTSAKPKPTLSPVVARVEPLCVKPGSTATVHAKSTPKSSVAYDITFSDGNSGAAPPFGKGYGGNDKGFTDSNGNFVSPFTLTPNTPKGKATLSIYVGEPGVGIHEGKTTFTVADPVTGTC